jgi:hypothetical protein
MVTRSSELFGHLAFNTIHSQAAQPEKATNLYSVHQDALPNPHPFPPIHNNPRIAPPISRVHRPKRERRDCFFDQGV